MGGVVWYGIKKVGKPVGAYLDQYSQVCYIAIPTLNVYVIRKVWIGTICLYIVLSKHWI